MPEREEVRDEYGAVIGTRALSPSSEQNRRWPFGPRLRIWSFSIPGVGTIIRPGRDGFADVATIRRRRHCRVWALPFGYALVRSRGRGVAL